MRVDLHFNSFQEFLEQTRKPATSGAGSSSTKEPYEQWDMGAGYDGTVKLANEGWPEGLAKMGKAAELLALPVGDRNYEPQPLAALSGDEVDVGLYLSSEPECMTDWTMVEAPSFGKVVKIIVNLSASAGCGAETLFRRGAAAVLLVDALESVGIRCEVWALPKSVSKDGDSVEKGSRKSAMVAHVLVKAADDPVELDRLAFMLAHPAVLRRLGFRLMEQQPENSWSWSKTHGGYGCPMQLPESERSEDDGVIYFGAQFMGWHTEKEMVQAVQALLDKFLEGATA
jgi:hypothetical protein